MAQTPRRSAPAKPRTAIPQLSWRDPQPAPIVLISGPEEVCAERATAAVREYLRAEDPSLEVSDVRADDYTQGTLLAVTSPSLFGEPRLVRVSGVEKCSDAFLTEALSYLAAPQEGATVILRHTGATVRGKKLLDAIRAGEGGGVEVPCAAVKRDGDRFDFAAGEFQSAKKRIAPVALRALVSAFADDLTELAAACQQLISDVPGDITEQVVERYYGGRVETSAFTVADTAIAGRYGDALISLRHALASGADPVPPSGHRHEAADHGAGRRQPRTVPRTRCAPGAQGLAGRPRASRPGRVVGVDARDGDPGRCAGGCRGQGCVPRSRVRARAPRHRDRDAGAVRSLTRNRSDARVRLIDVERTSHRRGAYRRRRPIPCGDGPSDASLSSARRLLGVRRPAGRWPTCGSPPGSGG